jgi:hypothetical protein
MSSSRYVRTAAGQAEIQTKSHQLTRPVRNLLLVINDSRTAVEWVAQVQGVTLDDLALLHAEGLIAEVGGAKPAAKPAPAPVAKPADLREPPAPATAPAAPAPRAGDTDWERTQEVIRHAGYAALYDALTSIGKAKLGLMRGYRFTLEVEKCNGPEELRALALKFVEQLRSEHGMGAVGEFTYAVGAVKA